MELREWIDCRTLVSGRCKPRALCWLFALKQDLREIELVDVKLPVGTLGPSCPIQISNLGKEVCVSPSPPSLGCRSWNPAACILMVRTGLQLHSSLFLLASFKSASVGEAFWGNVGNPRTSMHPWGFSGNALGNEAPDHPTKTTSWMCVGVHSNLFPFWRPEGMCKKIGSILD